MKKKSLEKYNAIIVQDGVLCYAHPITLNQQRKIAAQFPAFTCAELDKKAVKENAFKLRDKNGRFFGWCLTPSVSTQDFSQDNAIINGFYKDNAVFHISHDGGISPYMASFKGYGLRVSIHLKYMSDSKVTKSCVNKTLTNNICTHAINYNPGNSFPLTITSTAPVVMFGKREYLWLNRNECETNQEDFMDLVSLKIIAKAKGYKKGEFNFADNKKLQRQCVEKALQDSDEEELPLVMKGFLFEQENYQRFILPQAEKIEWPQNIENFSQFDISDSDSFMLDCTEKTK